MSEDLLPEPTDEISSAKKKKSKKPKDPAAFLSDWVDRQVLLQRLHISKGTLQNWRNGGHLAFSYIQGKIYYNVHDIKALLEANYSKAKKKDKDDCG